MTARTNQQGFSTVELLISLFIAAAFIGTGFQLFSLVTKDSNATRLRTAAASVANNTIQERAYLAGSPCSNSPSASTIAIPTADLPQATATITYSCPYGNSSQTTRITVAIAYGTPQETIERGLDVTK